MSIEDSPQADETRPRSQRDRVFVRRLSATLVVLAVLAALLSAANLAKGPRIDSVEANLDNLVSRSGQRVALRLDQPVEKLAADDVTISPNTNVTAEVGDSAITVQFDDILRYDTTYTVKLNNVAGTFSGAESTLEYSFTTPDSEIFYLHRDNRVDGSGTKQPDTINREMLTPGTASSVVFGSPRIQDFVALPNMIVVVILNDDNTNTMKVVPIDGGPVTEIALPGTGTVGSLRAAGSEGVVGYTFTSADGSGEKRSYEESLFVYDLAGSTGLPVEVTGLDGGPMSVMDWVFVPATTSIVAQAFDTSLFLVNPLEEAAASPLGQHVEMRGFVPGTNKLIVADPSQGSTIDLTTGTVAELQLPETSLSATAYPGKLAVLDENGRYARVYSDFSGPDKELQFTIAVTDAAGSRTVYQPASGQSRIQDFCVSPNGHYLAVETVSREGVSDDYPTRPAFSATTIVIVDLDTGASARGFSGVLLSWCA